MSITANKVRAGNYGDSKGSPDERSDIRGWGLSSHIAALMRATCFSDLCLVAAVAFWL